MRRPRWLVHMPLFSSKKLQTKHNLSIYFVYNLLFKNTFGEFCEKSSLTNTDPCSSKPCYNYGKCIKQDQNSYTCACNASYGGLGCRQNLVGACASNPCQRDGLCEPIGLTGNIEIDY